jgi:surface antigen
MHFSNVSIDPYTNSPYNGGKRNTQVGAHIGIVYGVNDDGTILIAEQNIGSFGKKYKTIKYNNYSIEVFYDSHVQIDLLDILCVSYGTIKIYRY